MIKNVQIHTDIGEGGYGGRYYKQDAYVDVKRDASVQKWAQVLGVHDYELLDLVKEFGPVIKHIRKGLLKKKEQNSAA